MKKIVVVVILILLFSPSYVSAFSPKPPEGGIQIILEECTNNIVENDYAFDILVSISEVGTEHIYDDINMDYRQSGFSHIFHDTLVDEYINQESDWVSFSAFYTSINFDGSDVLENDRCGAEVDEWNDMELYNHFDEFKVVVLDSNGSILKTSEIYNTSIILGSNGSTEDDTYFAVVYDKVENDFSLEERVVSEGNLNGLLGLSLLIVVGTFLASFGGGTVIVFSLIEPFFMRKLYTDNLNKTVLWLIGPVGLSVMYVSQFMGPIARIICLGVSLSLLAVKEYIVYHKFRVYYKFSLFLSIATSIVYIVFYFGIRLLF